MKSKFLTVFFNVKNARKAINLKTLKFKAILFDKYINKNCKI